MEWDDDGLDEPVPPLLPPDDRLWRHPSEVAAPGGRLDPGAPAPAFDRESSVVAVVALTSCISVLLTLGVVAIVRPLRTRIAVERVAAPVPVASVTKTDDVAELTAAVRPAVVQVVASHEGAADTWGSAVVYRSDGMAITAQHVIKGASAVRAILSTGKEVSASVVGSDGDTDIAVLDLEGDGFAVAAMGSTADVKVGQPAVTVGTPAGTSGGPIVRVSVISAMGQEVGTAGYKLVDMLQTDTTVAPGCSGAPVLSTDGAVIGIANANVSTDAGMIGYATPIDVAKSVASDLVEHGKVSRGWLGIEGDAVSSEQAHELGIAGGAIVQKVRPGSPAAAAGIATSDVITSIDDVDIASMAAVVVRLRTLHPGDTISLAVVHEGAPKRTVHVTLADKPA